MSVVNLKIKKLYEDAKLPTRADSGSAGMDLYAHLDNDYMRVIKPHTTEMISVGFAMETPNNTYGAIFARSGLASKKGLRPANCVGVVDSTYRGEVFVALHNDMVVRCRFSFKSKIHFLPSLIADQCSTANLMTAFRINVSIGGQ